MKCETFDDGNGVRGIVCSRNAPRKRCSCGELTSLLCDYPVAKFRHADVAPRVGDARTNIHNAKVFYVHEVNATERTVRVAHVAPTFKIYRGVSIGMGWAMWFERTLPGCDKPVCRRCVYRWKELDFCAAHGRLHAKELAEKAKGSER